MEWSNSVLFGLGVGYLIIGMAVNIFLIIDHSSK